MIKISVVIAAYATPNDGLDRLIESLAAQTLPKDEFEVIFVDDGSPDDTLARLHVLAESRPWVRVFSIPNSGWGSAPRNEGTRHARGEYMLYMDHDDTLYPDALRGLWEFAHANGSDVVSPKESKTNDSWWGLYNPWWPEIHVPSGNVANVLDHHGISAIVPLVPHKLYRRQLLLDHEITFPEGARILWEDQFFNIAAYSHARVVSVLADHPTYLWHASATNTSHTFDPSREDFWTMLSMLLEFTDDALSGPALQPEREFMRAQQVRVRVVDRTARLLVGKASEEEKQHGFDRARELLLKHSSPRLEAQLPQKHRVQATLMRQNLPELFALHHRSDVARAAHLKASGITWDGTTAQIRVQFRWSPRERATSVFRQVEDRILFDVPEHLKEAVPDSEWDVTEDVQAIQVRILARERFRFVSWQLPVTVEHVAWSEVGGVTEIYGEAIATLDLSSAQLGGALEPGVWDLRWSMAFAGAERFGGVTYDLPAKAAAISGVTATAYSNGKRGLTIDSSGWLRTVAIDARPQSGRIDDGDRLRVPLRRIAVSGATDRSALLYAVPEAEAADNLSPDAGVDLGARLVADGDGARLEADATRLTTGSFRIFALRGGKLRQTQYELTVDTDRTVVLSTVGS